MRDAMAMDVVVVDVARADEVLADAVAGEVERLLAGRPATLDV